MRHAAWAWHSPTSGCSPTSSPAQGGDFCDLANARSLTIAEALLQRYQDLDELHDLGPIDLHLSGCMNSCGHHHSGHIGILGVDKDGQEWYQISLGGSDGSTLSGASTPGKVLGPSFTSSEVCDAIEAILEVYQERRAPGERFVDALQRLGHEPFKAAANAVRVATAQWQAHMAAHAQAAHQRPDGPAVRRAAMAL